MNKLIVPALIMALAGSLHAYAEAPGQPQQPQQPQQTQQQQTEAADTSANVQHLDEVTVKAQEIIHTPDKMIVQVSRQVRRNAYDGYTALRLLSLPGVDVDVRNNSVSANGKSVLLCINGIEAETDEIKTLNPKDIIRIDYYTNFDPRHPTADYVMDFIMKIRESGGAFVGRAGQNLNKPKGSQMADWRMFHGKTEFGVRLTGGYNHFGHGEKVQETFSMMFPSGLLTRTERLLSTPTADNSLGTQFTLFHRSKNGVLKASVSLGTRHNRGTEVSERGYSNEPEPVRTTVSNHRDQLYPSFRVSYDHNLPDKMKLQFSLNGSYTHTDADRLYSSASTISSATHESYYSLHPRARITMQFGKKWNVYAVGHYFYDNSRQHYREDGRFEPSHLINGQAILETGANVKLLSALSVSFRLQERIVTTDHGDGAHTSSYFTPALTVSASLPRSNRIQASVFSGVFDPQLSYYSAGEKRVDEYLVTRGNPNLKLMKPVGLSFTFTSTHGWGDFRVNSFYENTSRSIYPTYTLDPERNLYVWSYVNGGHYETFYVNASASYNVIPQKLKLVGLVVYSHDKLRSWKLLEKGSVAAMGRVVYMSGPFNATAQVTTPQRGLARNGSYYRKPLELSLSAGYAVAGWNFQLDVDNPFIRATRRNTFSYGGVSENTVMRSPRAGYNYVAFTVSYRFNYGKKHKFENVDGDTAPNSAILSH